MASNNIADDNEQPKIAQFFEAIRAKRSAKSPYETDDVLAVFTLMKRGLSIADISRATLINEGAIRRWKEALLSGRIQMLFPDIIAAAETFDETIVPNIRPTYFTRERIPFAWKQAAIDIDAGINPYARKRLNGPNREATDD